MKNENWMNLSEQILKKLKLKKIKKEKKMKKREMQEKPELPQSWKELEKIKILVTKKILIQGTTHK